MPEDLKVTPNDKPVIDSRLWQQLMASRQALIDNAIKTSYERLLTPTVESGGD